MRVSGKHLTGIFFWCMIIKVIEMKEILEKALLYDFYGELLTDHQKYIYEQFILEDLSLSEIAQNVGISRQGVHDLVKRCGNILGSYEEKLHLVERFISIKGKLQEMERMLDNYNVKDEKIIIEEIRRVSKEIIEAL